MRILAFGDIFARSGRKAFETQALALKKEYNANVLIANIENASGGAGVTDANARELLELKEVDVYTSGNHIFDHKDVNNVLQESDRLIRPANYPEPCPGKGWTFFRVGGIRVCVINLSGNVFMRENLQNPFHAFDNIYDIVRNECDIILVDFHADATSEKVAFGHYADGRANVVFGTHTHVQTADERILPKGCGYITDIGMCGPVDGVIGVSRDVIIRQFLTQRKVRYEAAEGPVQLNGALFTLDEATFRCSNVERVQRIFD